MYSNAHCNRISRWFTLLSPDTGFRANGGSGGDGEVMNLDVDIAHEAISDLSLSWHCLASLIFFFFF